MDFLNALTNLSAQIVLEFKLKTVMGVEIEFYLNLKDEELPASLPYEYEDLVREIHEQLRSEGIPLFDVLQERGMNQFEVALKEQSDLASLHQYITRTRQVLAVFAAEKGLEATFDSKPYPELPGCGFHIHASLWNERGENAFFKKNELMALVLKHAIGGLLAALPESMPIFAPKAESYSRYVGNDPEVPSTISWGGNNRTTALRLPDSLSGRRHVEHRVPGMDADPAAALFVVLAGIHHGLRHQIVPPEQIFGNAYLPQYNLPRLPQTLHEAHRLLREGSILPYYLGDQSAQFLAEAA